MPKNELKKKIKSESIFAKDGAPVKATECEKKIGEGKELVAAVLDKMNTLLTSGMGLVAALAWNEAIKSLFDQIFTEQNRNSTWARFGYAATITIIIVIVTYRMTKILEKVKKTTGIVEEKEKRKEKREEA